jgi:two-component system nitrate/nitrite response regulator NarL
MLFAPKLYVDNRIELSYAATYRSISAERCPRWHANVLDPRVLSFKNMKIQTVVVHPSRIVQMALSDALKLNDHLNVGAECGTGNDLIKLLKIKSVQVDVILLDPTLESISLIDRIAEVSEAKVILLTLDDDSVAFEDWIKGGVRGLLGREADLSVLIKAINKVYLGEFWLNRFAVARLLSGDFRQAKEQTPEQASLSKLTVKEKLVIQAIWKGRGQTLRTTAKALNLSDKTIRNHLTAIYAKLNVANKTELFLFMQKHVNIID